MVLLEVATKFDLGAIVSRMELEGNPSEVFNEVCVLDLTPQDLANYAANAMHPQKTILTGSSLYRN